MQAGKVADTALKSYKWNSNSKVPGARDSRWRYIVDHLRPEGKARMKYLGK